MFFREAERRQHQCKDQNDYAKFQARCARGSASSVAHQKGRRPATDRVVRGPSGFCDELSDRKARPGSPLLHAISDVTARVTAVARANRLLRLHCAGVTP
jgi:hypothetical protein